MFYVLIDNVVTGLTVCFNAVIKLAENFDFLWKYPTMCQSKLERKAKLLARQYPSEVYHYDLEEEMQHLLVVHTSNYG